jgi:hypothetical protein|tara:strand:+ start:12 stop:527 length:516 start_codon:yes stop_codon:yes gene_type:complete
VEIKKLDILSVDFDWILNLKQQEELLSFLIPIIYKHNDITISLSHDKIYPIFTHGYDEYNLFNIDHHHDYHYDKSKLNELNEGNWLYHLSNVFKKKINYVWVSNPNSLHIHLKEMDKLKSFYFDHNIDFIKQKTFDKIFLCCSPDYAMTPEVITSYKIIERIINENKKPKP